MSRVYQSLPDNNASFRLGDVKALESVTEQAATGHRVKNATTITIGRDGDLKVYIQDATGFAGFIQAIIHLIQQLFETSGIDAVAERLETLSQSKQFQNQVLLNPNFDQATLSKIRAVADHFYGIANTTNNAQARDRLQKVRTTLYTLGEDKNFTIGHLRAQYTESRIGSKLVESQGHRPQAVKEALEKRLIAVKEHFSPTQQDIRFLYVMEYGLEDIDFTNEDNTDVILDIVTNKAHMNEALRAYEHRQAFARLARLARFLPDIIPTAGAGGFTSQQVRNMEAIGTAIIQLESTLGPIIDHIAEYRAIMTAARITKESFDTPLDVSVIHTMANNEEARNAALYHIRVEKKALEFGEKGGNHPLSNIVQNLPANFRDNETIMANLFKIGQVILLLEKKGHSLDGANAGQVEFLLTRTIPVTIDLTADVIDLDTAIEFVNNAAEVAQANEAYQKRAAILKIAQTHPDSPLCQAIMRDSAKLDIDPAITSNIEKLGSYVQIFSTHNMNADQIVYVFNVYFTDANVSLALDLKTAQRLDNQVGILDFIGLTATNIAMRTSIVKQQKAEATINAFIERFPTSGLATALASNTAAGVLYRNNLIAIAKKIEALQDMGFDPATNAEYAAQCTSPLLDMRANGSIATRPFDPILDTNYGEELFVALVSDGLEGVDLGTQKLEDTQFNLIVEKPLRINVILFTLLYRLAPRVYAQGKASIDQATVIASALRPLGFKEFAETGTVTDGALVTADIAKRFISHFRAEAVLIAREAQAASERAQAVMRREQAARMREQKARARKHKMQRSRLILDLFPKVVMNTALQGQVNQQLQLVMANNKKGKKKNDERALSAMRVSLLTSLAEQSIRMGGTGIPHFDKEVLDTFFGGEAQGRTARILENPNAYR